MSKRSDTQKNEFLAELASLIQNYESAIHLSNDRPRKASGKLALFVLQHKEIITETLKCHADFRTHEEWEQDEDDAWFDEEYD